MNTIKSENIAAFEEALVLEEKAKATVRKYGTAILHLSEWLGERQLSKGVLLEYRDDLLKVQKVKTVNGNLSAINAYLTFCQMPELKLSLLKVQRHPFLEDNRELTQQEYKKLLAAAQQKKNQRMYLLMMTLAGTGIRISELKYITVEAAKAGRVQIHMKGKCRIILLTDQLCLRLLSYSEERKIVSGYIFRTRNGKPMDRSNIYHAMKKMCEKSGIDSHKVFPHNLRHLFARVFYEQEKNLAYLADVLGHSSIETTRIYVAASATTHQKILNKMSLVE